MAAYKGSLIEICMGIKGLRPISVVIVRFSIIANQRKSAVRKIRIVVKRLLKEFLEPSTMKSVLYKLWSDQSYKRQLDIVSIPFF